jgi:hypothetical protein
MILQGIVLKRPVDLVLSWPRKASAHQSDMKPKCHNTWCTLHADTKHMASPTITVNCLSGTFSPARRCCSSTTMFLQHDDVSPARRCCKLCQQQGDNVCGQHHLQQVDNVCRQHHRCCLLCPRKGLSTTSSCLLPARSVC